ncbi:GEVED domain-containing protein [Blastopirellula sp. J2-11]|uniref:GEVED domain-containing protein n=1 Tax=Blastopirellula sp. J2-11 TaxID=2943192 RepID=UPI0021C8A389|nr:GEVED domain-containing protein [Blastopirellula sp. J2-11]UUO08814.1 GEVED domain-containing protein [Blastopirellula sp. J2-11]
MKRSSGNRPRKTSNRKKFRGSQAKIESLEARMVMDAAGYDMALDAFMGEDRIGRDGPTASIGWNLTQIYYGADLDEVSDPDAAGGSTNQGESLLRDQFVIDSNNRIVLDLAAKDAASLPQFLNDLAGIGFELTGQYNNAISGWLPIDSLAELAALPALGAVGAAAPKSYVGVVNSQGDAAMQTDVAKVTYGLDGSGQKIGVLSDSYDALGGAAADIASGDLPGATNPNGYTTPVQVLEDYFLPDATDEGRGMLQLVHDVAPGAQLAYQTAFTGKTAFAQGILNLAAAGSTVIVDDIGYATEPFFSDGAIAQAADQVVSQNIPYFTAAGNSSRDSYEDAYVSSGTVYTEGQFTSATGAPVFMGGTSMDFDPGAGVDDRMSITVPAGATFVISLQWDDPFLTDQGVGAGTNIDAYFLVGNQVVAGGVDMNQGSDAYEFFGFDNRASATDTTIDLMVTNFAGVDPTRLKFLIWGGQGTINEYETNSSTAIGHSNAELAMSVGAAFYGQTPVFGADPAELETFSSYGGTPIIFDASGVRLATPVYRENVDIVAPDGTDTTFFGATGAGDIESNGFPNFFGTSAAAPHAAALAALMLQANPELISTQVNDILRDTAIDMDDPVTAEFDTGFDYATGYGFVDGVAAIELAINTVGLNPGGGGDGGGGDVTPPSCGVYYGPAAVEVQAALGANLFVTGHPMLDNGVANGQLGYDYEVLDLLRGIGTFQEIPKSQYSIAVIGNSDADWGFSTGTQFATGYESTTFYDVDNITPALWSQILSNDALIILSDVTSVTTGGLTGLQIDTIVDAKDAIAEAVNTHGLDLWTNAGSASTGYYDILPTGAVDFAALTANATPYAATTEGQAIGITYAMANAAEAAVEFTDFDDDLHELETRAVSEIVSLAATNIAFVNDEIISISQAGSYMLNGVTGYKFNDTNLDGIRQGDEGGLAGFTFFIDEDGDGRIGLCEPSAVTDASGKYTLYPRYSGTFNVLQVVEPGYFSTDDVQHVISVNGQRITLNASLDSGAVVAIDYGDPGNPYAAHPVVDGFQLGDSPLANDGVVFSTGLKVGTNSVSIASSSLYSPGILQAWMDFNKDGDFNDPGEQIFRNLTLQDGTHNYTFVIPDYVIDDSGQDPMYRIPLDVRFRVDYTLNLGPTGEAFAGEVEDYEVNIAQGPDGGIRLTDDTFTYVEDTADQTFDVLANDKSFFNRALTIVDITDAPTMAILDALSIVDNKIVFDATGIVDLENDITFSYTVMDSKGFMETAEVTLKAADANLAVMASASFFNPSFGGDVNNDGFITSHDLAIVLRELDNYGTRSLPQIGTPTEGFAKYIDTNGDNSFDALDIVSLLEKMVQNQIRHQEEEVEAEAVDAAFVEDQPAAPSTSSMAAPLTLQTPLASGLTTTQSSSLTNDVSGYLAGVFEKPSKQSNLLSQQSTTPTSETESDSELDEQIFSDNSFEFLLMDSASSSTYMSEDVESTIDEIAIDVDAAWEEDLISG